MGGGGGERSAEFVVGCDGSHSGVRKLIGVDFVGKQYETHILLADVLLTHPPAETMFARNSNDGVVLCVPFGDGWYRAIAWDRARAGPAGRAGHRRRDARRVPASQVRTSG